MSVVSVEIGWTATVIGSDVFGLRSWAGVIVAAVVWCLGAVFDSFSSVDMVSNCVVASIVCV